jgi:hypothetical protein
MAIVKKFEELEMWKKSSISCNEMFDIINPERFSKDFRMCHEMNGSNGFSMDKIAEGFNRGSR